MVDTDMDRFLSRIHLTERLSGKIIPILKTQGFLISSYGQDRILRGNSSMRGLIRERELKFSRAARMVKYSPDYICAAPLDFEEYSIFSMDIKASITPVFFGAHIRRLREGSGISDLRREDIMVIEREAWDTYNDCYPNHEGAIFMAAPYNPRLILGEWVSNIDLIYRRKGKRDMVNPESAGSGTPHVNLHMGRMRTLKEFLKDEFDIEISRKRYRLLEKEIMSWSLNKPAGRVNWTQFNNVVDELRKTCPWLQNRRP